MCVTFFAQDITGYSLIIASNRDEFLDRPTLPLSSHAFYSGLDLSNTNSDSDRKGTWLGIKPREDGYDFAFVLNYRFMLSDIGTPH
jgi:uncharacterized protein with NRDE domain